MEEGKNHIVRPLGRREFSGMARYIVDDVADAENWDELNDALAPVYDYADMQGIFLGI